MADFCSALAGWKGRPYVEAEIKRRGFGLSFEYQKYIEYLGNADKGDDISVQEYWNEVAMEYICSGGAAQSDIRRVPDGSLYRSAYLDSLARARAVDDRELTGAPLSFCVEKFREENENNNYIHVQNLWKIFSRRKVAEICSLGLSGAVEFLNQSNLWKLATEIAQNRGFFGARVSDYNFALKAKGFAKELPNGLVFYFGIDADSNGINHGYVPIEFFISHIGSPDRCARLRNFDVVSPGFQYYSVFDSPDAAALGISALIEACDILSSSFNID